jgi:hypothetical protein
MRNGGSGGSVIVVALGLMGLIVATSPALSQMNCNPRAGYPPARNWNEHFAGLFRIPMPHCLPQHGDLASSDDVPDARSKVRDPASRRDPPLAQRRLAVTAGSAAICGGGRQSR